MDSLSHWDPQLTPTHGHPWPGWVYPSDLMCWSWSMDIDGCWFETVANMFALKLGMMISPNQCIFQRGRSTTNQIGSMYSTKDRGRFLARCQFIKVVNSWCVFLCQHVGSHECGLPWVWAPMSVCYHSMILKLLKQCCSGQHNAGSTRRNHLQSAPCFWVYPLHWWSMNITFVPDCGWFMAWSLQGTPGEWMPSRLRCCP